MGLTVTVLGADGSYAGPGGACTGYLVQSADASVWLDCGPGTAGRLQELVALRDLAAIVCTHEHPDHWLELPTIYNALRYYELGDPVPVYGTLGTRRLAASLCHGPLDDVFDWRVIADGATFTVRDQAWRCSRTDHPVETLAVRVDVASCSFAFTADTASGWSLAELGSGIDLAISEATFLSDLEGQGIPHLSAREAGELARLAGVGALVITHLTPGSDPEPFVREAQASFGGPVEVARPGAVFTC